jgi:hypothetical protein
MESPSGNNHSDTSHSAPSLEFRNRRWLWRSLSWITQHTTRFTKPLQLTKQPLRFQHDHNAITLRNIDNIPALQFCQFHVLCGSCQKIFRRSRIIHGSRLRYVPASEKHVLHPSLRHMEQSVQQQCHFCTLTWHDLQRFLGPTPLSDVAHHAVVLRIERVKNRDCLSISLGRNDHPTAQMEIFEPKPSTIISLASSPNPGRSPSGN